MAVSISNLSTKFANSSFTYNAISMNVTTGLYEANSKILTLKANGVVKFSVDVNGHTVAAGMNLVPTIQAAFNKANTGGGTGGDIGPPFDQANSAYLIANLAFDKANSANLLAFNTGSGSNTYLLSVISGANIAVGTGANAFTSATISGANTAVGAGANAFASATIAGANAITTSAFAQANTARTQANTARTQANTAYDKANAANVIASAAFDKANLSGNSFGTVNANGTLVVSDTTGDTITFLTGNNISIVGDAVNDRVTVGLTNDVIVPGLLSVMATGGDEGGEIQLANALTNSVLSGNIVIDVYQNRLRFFEQSGTNRGAFINLASASAGVGTDLLAATSATDTLARSTANAAFDKANAANVLAFNALPNTSGVSFAGNLNITGNTTSDRIAVGTSISSTYRLIVSGTMTLVGGGYRVLSDVNNQNLWRDAADTTTRMTIGYNATAIQGVINVVNTAAPLVISTSNAERMRIDPSGNVGIGTTSPTSNLHVIGTANITSTLTASSYISNGVNISPIGKHTIWVPAVAMYGRITNGAASGTVETTTNDVMIKTLDFDTTTQEFAQFAIQMPKGWNEGTLICQFVWSHPSTTTNFGVVWQIQAVAFANDDALDTAFGTAVTVADTGGTTNDLYITTETSAMTVAGSPGAEEYVVFQIARVPANASDTMAVDARLHGVKIHYTIDAAKDD